MAEKIIILGSENWGKNVPDEYAITAVARFKIWGRPYEYLDFSYVEPASFMDYEGGYVQKFCQLELLSGIEEIIILQNDVTSPPALLLRKDGKLEFMGCLDKLAGVCSPEQPKFAKNFHYSGRTSGAQKCDEDAPEWLKDLAYDHNANVAYFKLENMVEKNTKPFPFIEE